MSRYKYKKFRKSQMNDDYIDTERIEQIRERIKQRKRVFGRLLEVPIEKMTINELEYFEKGLDTFYVSVERTKVPKEDIHRMFSINENQYTYLIDQKENILAEVEKYKIINKDNTNQENSVIFTPDFAKQELEEYSEDMYYMYKCLLPPDDICDYFRIFPVEVVWKTQIRLFQQRIRDEFKEEIAEYNRRNRRGLTKDRDMILYEYDKILARCKYEREKQIKEEKKESIDKRKKEFLGITESDNTTNFKPSLNNKKTNKNMVIGTDGTEINLWGLS